MSEVEDGYLAIRKLMLLLDSSHVKSVQAAYSPLIE